MSLRRLSRNALAAVGQVLISAVLLFELYRFLTRQLGPAQIGLWSLVMAGAAVARLSEFGLGGGVARFVALDLGAGQRHRAARTVGIAALAIGLVMALVCVVAAPALDWLLARVVREPENLLAAHALVPYALIGLWLSTLANVFLSALDGCQRSERRALVTIGAAAVQLLASYVLVPEGRLAALGPVHLLQTGAMLLASMVLALVTIAAPPSAWWPSDRQRLSELLRYGGAIQAAALGQLLFEPTVKMLLAHYGGLAATAYFEMANRAVTQLRSIIVAAYQTLVPYLAHRSGASEFAPAQAKATYLTASRFLFVIGTPFYAVLGMLLPLVLTLWLGRFDPQFVEIGLICAVGWYVNTLTVAAYMLALAIGRPRWIMWNQLTIGVLSLVLGVLGGLLAGGPGVIAGAMLALALGSTVVVSSLHREYALAMVDALPPRSLVLFAECFVPAVACVWLSFTWQGQSTLTVCLMLAVGGCTALCAVVAWRHPVMREALARLRPQQAHGE